MAFSVRPEKFHFGEELRQSVADRRVVITGAGEDGGLGQAFALAAGLNGAVVIGVHFHRSYVDGFLTSTHLWAGEAVYHPTSLPLIYVSSRQAIDPGVSVPGYAMSNGAVLQLPKVLAINLGRQAQFVTAASILLLFVRTSMTDEYADNPKVFGRWQPRMLETHEEAQAFLQLLTRPKEELDHGMLEFLTEGSTE